MALLFLMELILFLFVLSIKESDAIPKTNFFTNICLPFPVDKNSSTLAIVRVKLLFNISYGLSKINCARYLDQ